MLQESTTIAGILAKVQEIASGEPVPTDLQTASLRVHELRAVSSNAPVVDAPSPMQCLTQNPRPHSGLRPEALEAVFANAMREAISPMVQRWVNTHQEELISALGPIFRQWMDQRLPKLVSSGLKEELRLSSERRSTAHS